VNHDRFHPVADSDPLWTETTWWGFAVPERPLGGMVYTLFRPNVGVASVVVQVWDGDAVEPWRAPYARSLWHVPFPAGDLDDLEVGPLHLRCLEPGTSYSVTYDDGDSLRLDLRYDAAMEPHAAIVTDEVGHLDQLCHVTGTATFAGDEVAIDAHAMRDRSWYVRRDQRSMRAGYTYGAVDGDEQFLVFSRPADGETEEYAVHGGYLVRDGEQAAITSGVRRTLGRRRGHPDDVEVMATDALGRDLVALGKVTASLASASTPGMFAWMSVADWDLDGRTAHGEDHDVWSPDHLAALHRRSRP
jgi:hypothetical protein